MKDIIRPVVPLYRQLADRYREDILHRRLLPGDRIHSINEIQEEFQVSRETAKRVLSVLVEEGFVVQQAGKGSFVADLRPKQRIWGIILPFYSGQYEDLVMRFTGLAASLDREVQHFCDHNNWEEELRLVGRMLSQGYEAIVVIPTNDQSRTVDFYARLSPRELPVVLFDHTMAHSEFPYVIQSYDLGVVRAIDYLLTTREGTITFIRNEVWGGRNMVQELMEETYKSILQRVKREPLVFRADQLNSHHVDKFGITGIFCSDDASAIRVMGRLREQGVSIPGRVRLVSYGNTDLARFFTPSITSIDPHNQEMAEKLIELLKPLLDGEPVPRKQHVTLPDLVVRQT